MKGYIASGLNEEDAEGTKGQMKRRRADGIEQTTGNAECVTR